MPTRAPGRGWRLVRPPSDEDDTRELRKRHIEYRKKCGGIVVAPQICRRRAPTLVHAGAGGHRSWLPAAHTTITSRRRQVPGGFIDPADNDLTTRHGSHQESERIGARPMNELIQNKFRRAVDLPNRRRPWAFKVLGSVSFRIRARAS